MRIIYALLFAFTFGNSFGQFYIDSLSTSDIDEHFERANNYYSDNKNEKALQSFDSLEVKLNNILDPKSEEKLYQNYYFIKIRQFQTKKKLRITTPADEESFFGLENQIKTRLSKNNIVNAAYYSIMANYQRTILSNLNRSIYYSNKVLDIYNFYDTTYLDNIGREYIEMGYGYKSFANYEKAEEHFLLSKEAKERINPPPTKSILYSKYALASLYNNQQKYDEALKISLEIIDSAQEYFDTNHKMITNTLDLIAIIYNEKGNSEKSLDYSFAGLRSMGPNKGKVYLNAEKQYERISVIYGRMGKYNLSIKYLDSAFISVKKSGKNNRIASVYNTKFLHGRNINEGLSNLKNAIKYCKKDPWCSKINLPIFLSNLGITYSQKGDTRSALSYVLKSKDIKEKNHEKLGVHLPSTYVVLAINYYTLGMLEEADMYYNKAIETTIKYRGHDNYFLASTYNSYGKFLLDTKDFDKANIYLMKTAKIQKNKSNRIATTYTLNNLYLSTLFQEKGNFDKSIKHALISYKSDQEYNKASENSIVEQMFNVYHEIGKIDSCRKMVDKLLDLSGFKQYDASINQIIDMPHGSHWLSSSKFFNYLKLESRLPEQQPFLIEKIKYGLLINKKLRAEVFYESSEKEIQESIREFYNWSIKQLGIRYKQTNEIEYLNLLFECIERSKSVLLERQQIREAALSKSNIPKDIIDKEKDLLYEYEETYTKYAKNTSESDSISDVNMQNLYRVQKKKEAFIDSLKQFFPDYYDSRYEQNITTLQECRDIALKEDRKYIIYHWGDSILHRISIYKSDIDYTDIIISDIETQLLQLEKLIKTPISQISETNFDSDKKEIITLSRYLYLKLIGEKSNIPKFLTIIPDGKLVHLPFEILLTEEVNKTEKYHSLPYLLKHSPINYCGSMSQFHMLSKQDGYKNDKGYVGFAPSYISRSSSSESPTRGDETSTPLLHNISEILQSSALFDGENYISTAATEQKFKTKALQSNILHLAMHTKINLLQSFDSYLQFDPDTTTVEDGKLYLDEIAMLDLKSNLVVLSACETNVGEEIVGESILGIARAFHLASCPNIVLTNWLIDDKSSSSIIHNFLEGINKNEQPPIALQNAKIQYLKSCSDVQSHPYFWSGYSYYGSAEIKNLQSNLWRNIFLIIFGVIIFSYLFYRFRKINSIRWFTF